MQAMENTNDDFDIGSDYLDHVEAEYAEDDPVLKRSIEQEEAIEGEIPNTYPHNDNALNAEILGRQESEEQKDDREETT